MVINTPKQLVSATSYRVHCIRQSKPVRHQMGTHNGRYRNRIIRQAVRELTVIVFIWGTAIIGGLCIWLSSSTIPAMGDGGFLPFAALIDGLMTQTIHQVFAN